MVKDEIMDFINENLPQDKTKYESEVNRAATVAERNIQF